MKGNEINFRDVYHKICYVSAGQTVKTVTEHFENAEVATGILAYGYIDYHAGLTFEVLACADLDAKGEITAYKGNDDVTIKCRSGSFSDCDIFILEQEQFVDVFTNKIQMINEGYKVNEFVEATRRINIIDECRNQNYPDDVLVILYREGNQPEGCWVRCVKIAENGIIGELLNEPNADFTVHCGDEIKFAVMKAKEKIMCISVFE